MWPFKKKVDNSHLDFEHRCCFSHQIHSIAGSSKDGEVEVEMKSGKTAIFLLSSVRYPSAGEYTGQRNWYYKFIKYNNQG